MTKDLEKVDGGMELGSSGGVFGLTFTAEERVPVLARKRVTVSSTTIQ